MRRKVAEPTCVICAGFERHSPTVALPAMDPKAMKRIVDELPEYVECGCTYIWEHPVSDDNAARNSVIEECALHLDCVADDAHEGTLGEMYRFAALEIRKLKRN